jgi:hypothetical protein
MPITNPTLTLITLISLLAASPQSPPPLQSPPQQSPHYLIRNGIATLTPAGAAHFAVYALTMQQNP